ncbi:MAG: HAD family hydrolase [Clostridia bacterium]|nr:HAD family hydrolase [Clostridia bacterium]
MKKLILFDLDGTLLPMDLDVFTKAYFYALVKKLAQLGLPASTEEEQKALASAVWVATGAMMKNDGSCTNEERFFSVFEKLLGIDFSGKKDILDEFYKNEFNQISAVCGINPKVAEIISALKKREVRIAIATNPLFPLRANEMRLGWAGLQLSDFEYCTCYENSSFCKPNLDYYRAILKHLGVDAKNCMMVGNDVREDMVARELGMEVFLITDCLINVENKDISQYPHGSWDDFRKYIGL